MYAFIVLFDVQNECSESSIYRCSRQKAYGWFWLGPKCIGENVTSPEGIPHILYWCFFLEGHAEDDDGREMTVAMPFCWSTLWLALKIQLNQLSSFWRLSHNIFCHLLCLNSVKGRKMIVFASFFCSSSIACDEISKSIQSINLITLFIMKYLGSQKKNTHSPGEEWPKSIYK